MFTVYILYSIAFGKSYCGYTNNISRRFEEHNYTEKSGFTLRYRPWTLIHTETFVEKKDAMQREKFLKTGKGRVEIQILISKYLEGSEGAVSALAEMD